MKVLKTEEFMKMEILTPGKRSKEILTNEDDAKDLAGLFVVFEPGHENPYHYHERRESLFIIISGEAVGIIEGEETYIKAGDVIYIPAGKKHQIVNRSDKEFKFLEFFTCPPLKSDWVEVNRTSH